MHLNEERQGRLCALPKGHSVLNLARTQSSNTYNKRPLPEASHCHNTTLNVDGKVRHMKAELIT